MDVQKLANYEELRARWLRQAVCAARDAVIPMLIAVFGVAWLVASFVKINGESPAYWVCVGVMIPFGLLLMLPLIQVAAGPRPTPESVEQNKAIRRAFGMSDEVAGDH